MKAKRIFTLAENNLNVRDGNIDVIMSVKSSESFNVVINQDEDI